MDLSVSETNTAESGENPYNASVSNLSNGILDIYSESLSNIEKQLKELTSKQNCLVNQIHNENLNIARVQHAPEINDIFNKMKIYHNKLLNIKKDMKFVYERSTKLKKRVLRLQQAKEKERLRSIGEADSKSPEIIIGQPSTSSGSGS